MATKLTKAQETMLANIQQYFPIDYFTREDYKEKVGGRLPTESTLNKLVEYGRLEKKDSSYRLVAAGADVSINTFAVEDKKTSTDAVSMLFSVRGKIDTEYEKIQHWMGNKTYAETPDTQIGIYRIVDKLNDKILYIGKTEASFQQRWAQHIEELMSGTHHCVGLQEYFNTVLNGDINNIDFKIHEELPADSTLIDNRERFWIEYFGNSVMNTVRPRLVSAPMSLPEITASNEQKTLAGLERIARFTASAIHDYLYAAVKLSDQDKATLIAGIIIALNHEYFKKTYCEVVDEDEFMDAFDRAIKWSIQKSEYLKTGHDAIYSSFDFIKHNANFKKTIEHNNTRYIALQLLTEIIENSICRIAKDYPEYDVMGDFYNEFAKYSGADQQSLGIVLTPHHIADFMSELLDINENDIILDICCGTGALPIAARKYSTNRIVGVEYQPRMMALCFANMIMRGYNSTLYLGDSFGEDMLAEIKTQKPTKMIINPPYAQEGYPELGFIKRGLDQLVEGGLGVAIVPTSCAIKNDTLTKNLKEEILGNHQLLATFSMPDQLFYPVGVVTIVMLFRAHTPHSDVSFFGYMKDDGFEITRTSGRQDTQNKWADIRDEMLTLYRESVEEAGKSALEEVGATDEWCCEAYMKTDYSDITPEMFKSEMINFNLFCMKGA